MARKKKLSKKEQCIQDLLEVEDDIQLRIEHFDYYYSTMQHFKEPKFRLRGIDTIQYEKDFIGLKTREIELKKRFNENYKTRKQINRE